MRRPARCSRFESRPLEACRQVGVGEGVASGGVPAGVGRLAHLTELEYESLGLGDSLLILHFDGPVDYRIAQRGDLRTVELRVRVGTTSRSRSRRRPSSRRLAPPSRHRVPRRRPLRRAIVRRSGRESAPRSSCRLRDQSAVDPRADDRLSRRSNGVTCRHVDALPRP